MITEYSIAANIKAITEAIEMPVSIDEPSGLMTKLDKLVYIKATSSQTVADAKKHQRDFELKKMKELMNDGYFKTLGSASERNSFLKASCGNVEALYDHAERLDKAVSYAIEGVRTMISLLKTEIEVSRFGS